MYLLGLGVDPLTLVMDILVAAVFDAGVFDELLGDGTAANAEGRVVGVAGRADRAGIPFTAESVDRFARRAPMQPAGAAVLRLAWRHRAVILAGG